MAKLGITIYFTPEDKKLIEERSVIFGRSQTSEVEFLVREGLTFQDIKSKILLDHGIPKETLTTE